MKTSGVYQIRCTSNQKVYVGSATVSIGQRWNLHRSQLRSGKHANRYLRAAWNKYGEAAFVFAVLEVCPKELCLAREQFWIDSLKAADRRYGFNCRPKAENNLGLKFSEESRRKVSEAVRGKKHTPEAIERMRAAARIRGVSPITRAAQAASRRGKPISDEQKAKQSAKLKGRKHGPERVAKQAASLRGYRHSPEVCAYMSQCQKGKKHSEATKAKMSVTRKGRKYSEAHRRAISEGHRRRRASASGVFTFMLEDAG